MSTLSVTNPTMADVAKTLNPDGSPAKIVEILEQTNDILLDAAFIEGNLPTGHRSSIRTGIPDATWRMFYQAVPPSKSRYAQVTDGIGMLEAYGEVDKALADLNGNTKAFRFSEDKSHIQGMSNEMAQTLFYGNASTAPEEFNGLAIRFNSLSGENGVDNIIDAGGQSTDNTSIWLVVWSPETAHCIFPKGSQAGLQNKDLGEVTKENSSGLMQVYRSHYKWDCGFVLRDWRYVVRIANIEVSDLDTLANTKNILTWMIQATERIPQLGMGRPVFYMNRKIREKLRLGILEKIATNLNWDNVSGKRVMTFDEIPVRRCDQLLNTESRIT